MATSVDALGSPFDSPASFTALPRVGELTLSPDGNRLVASVAQVDHDGGKFVSALWGIDPNGVVAPRQLTRSSQGESSAAFLPDGSLLFTSTRPRTADVTTDDHAVGEKAGPEVASLWVLPADGGDAVLVAHPPGGVTAVVTGRATPTVVVAAKSAPGARTVEQDQEWWKARRAQKVSAVLHERPQLRHWDHHLGPDEIHLYVTTVDPTSQGEPTALRDITPDAGQALYDSRPVLSADGTTVVVDWVVPLERGRYRIDVVAIEVATGSRRTLASTEDGSYVYQAPALSADGTRAVTLRVARASTTQAWVVDLWLIDLVGGTGRALGVGDQPFIHDAVFTADSSALIVTTDCGGQAPLFKLDLESGDVTRLTEGGAWSSPQVDPGGQMIFAMRSAMNSPPAPVRLAVAGHGEVERGTITTLPAPGSIEGVPGRVEEVTTVAEDGTPLRAWLILPEASGTDAPYPLALWVHGGPVSSWNSWSWRWNPWLLAARGWAVLLPDPALSTGYGHQMVQRGWGQWGGAPYDDLMAMTDAALERPDLDPTRTAAMGGSYGGYMANWIAGHTERFDAIVSHASIWSLEQFMGTTDYPTEWADEWGYPDTHPELYANWSPDRFIDAICTPMLLIHGEHDYRCPVSESLRLWNDLVRKGVEARFLWFANENHWILQPGDAIVWYETVFAFLDHHVLGRAWHQPEVL